MEYWTSDKKNFPKRGNEGESLGQVFVTMTTSQDMTEIDLFDKKAQLLRIIQKTKVLLQNVMLWIYKCHNGLEDQWFFGKFWFIEIIPYKIFPLKIMLRKMFITIGFTTLEDYLNLIACMML